MFFAIKPTSHRGFPDVLTAFRDNDCLASDGGKTLVRVESEANYKLPY